MAKKTALDEFNAVWPVLKAVLLEEAAQELPPDELEDYEKNLDANSKGGKRIRGLSVPDSVAILVGAPLSADQHLLASALGWTTELFQASCLVADDMMDRSVTRRGQPCWYRRAGVGLLATRDSFMLELGAYALLARFFVAHPAYVPMVELFHETTCQTEVGQLCDLLTAPEGGKANLEGFSLEKYRFIVTYKTSYYSFYLPVALALHLCQIATPKNLRQAEEILVAMGEYFQVQDDFLDSFAPPKHFGKIGTDIVDNKCTWLVNQALIMATPEQRETLIANYGRHSKSKEDAVRRLYEEIDLRQRYKDYEEQRVVEIRDMISAVDEREGLKKEVFEAFLAKIYRRNR